MQELIYLQGCLFRTYGRNGVGGVDFTYKIHGGEMFVDRKEKSITRATVMKAYKRVVELDGEVKGPKTLGTFGASYLYPIFVKMGVIRMEWGGILLRRMFGLLRIDEIIWIAGAWNSGISLIMLFGLLCVEERIRKCCGFSIHIHDLCRVPNPWYPCCVRQSGTHDKPSLIHSTRPLRPPALTRSKYASSKNSPLSSMSQQI